MIWLIVIIFGKNVEEASNALITVIFLVCDRMVNVLFDLVSTFSYVLMRLFHVLY